MDFQPSTLFDLPFVTNLLRVSSTAFAGVAVLTAGLVVLCVGKECGKLRRSAHRNGHASGSGSPVRVPAGR